MTSEDLQDIRNWLEAAVPGSVLEIQSNALAEAPGSLVLEPSKALQAAQFLKEDPRCRFDMLTNLTGVDWLDRQETVTVGQGDDARKEQKTIPGFLEVVLHLVSVEKRKGPLMLRLRTRNRESDVSLPSMVPVWRSAELQEREVLDLYGIQFDGHPDPRRLLMWDEFVDHPMRKDYVEPDDYEYEPTPHGDVHDKARRHYFASQENA